MISVSSEFLASLTGVTARLSDVVEIETPGGWTYWADHAFEWNGRAYLGRLLSRSAIERGMGPELDRVTLTFSNADGVWRTTWAASPVGQRVFVRRLDRSIEGSGGDAVVENSVVIFAGVIRRVTKLDAEVAECECVELLGDALGEIPGREFQLECPWDFKSEQCGYVGAEATCDKSWARCSALANTDGFGGMRYIPHTGTFAFSESVMRRSFLLFLRRKTVWRTGQFESVDSTPYGTPLPIVFGRAPMAGIVIHHADEGTVLKGLAAFCVGPIHSIDYLRANDELVAEWTAYIGEAGGSGAQVTDPRFPDGYPYNRVAYVSLEVPSAAAQVDAAPTIHGLVKGMQVRQFNGSGAFTGFAWSANPMWVMLGLLQLPLAEGGAGLPETWFDLAALGSEAAYCDQLVDDVSGDQRIVEPTSGDVAVGDEYQRFRSVGVPGDEMTGGPYVEAGDIADDTGAAPTVQIARWTLNGALARRTRTVDVLHTMLRCCRAYRRYSGSGQIQFVVDRPSASVMALNAAVLVGPVEYPVIDRRSEINRVSVKFYDAPSSVERPLTVNDYVAQASSRAIRPLDLDGMWIDSAHQAFRVAQYQLLRQRADFARATIDARGALLQVGDVVTVTDAPAGLTGVLMQVTGMVFDEQMRCEVELQRWFSTYYVDSSPRLTTSIPSVLPATSPPLLSTDGIISYA